MNPDGTATIGPNLQGVGAATVDFWVSTGRMPATDVKAVEAERKPSRLTPLQALELAAWVNSLDPSVPAVPYPHLARRTSRLARTSSPSTARPATPSRGPVTPWPSGPTHRRCRTAP